MSPEHLALLKQLRFERCPKADLKVGDLFLQGSCADYKPRLVVARSRLCHPGGQDPSYHLAYEGHPEIDSFTSSTYEVIRITRKEET